MTSDPYADVLDRIWAEHTLPAPDAGRDRLTSEIEDRRGLRVEQSQRVDLPPQLAYEVKLFDQDGRVVAYGHGEHPRHAAIDALVRLIESKHERQF